MNHTQALGVQRTAAALHTAPERRGNTWVLPTLTLSLGLAWLAARGGWYKPGDDFGYYLGLTGGVMMLLLLLYPLRKRFRFLQPLGLTRHWFRMHMVFGLTGPLLIIIHSGFTIGSLNAGVALACMLLVASSGVIGRFIYTRIHHGLYGRKATLQEMQIELGIHEGEVRSRFHFVPRVEACLKTFGELAHTRPDGFFRGAWQFLTIGLHARHTHARCMQELRKVLGRYAAERGWERAKLRRRLGSASKMIRAYLTAARHVAQFGAYERLFSLWHILHVPFVFMLAVSGVVHVIAVHMY